MIRGKENVTFQKDLSTIKSADDTVLFQLVKKNDKYYVRPINDNQPSDRLWLVIRSLKDGYVIKRHDILKLGRMKFKVKEYRTETEFFEGDHIETGPHKGFDELHEVESSDSTDITITMLLCKELILIRGQPPRQGGSPRATLDRGEFT